MRANKSENNEKKKKNSIIIIYEQMCVHPIREWMRILLDDDESTTSNFSKEQLLKRVLFALDACGKINVFFEEEDERGFRGGKGRGRKSVVWKVDQ